MKKTVVSIMTAVALATASAGIAKADGLLLNQQSTTTGTGTQVNVESFLDNLKTSIDKTFQHYNITHAQIQQFLNPVTLRGLKNLSFTEYSEIKGYGEQCSKIYGNFAAITQNLALPNAQITQTQSWTSFIMSTYNVVKNDNYVYYELIYLLSARKCPTNMQMFYPPFVLQYVINNNTGNAVDAIEFLATLLAKNLQNPNMQGCELDKAIVAKTIAAIFDHNTNAINALYKQDIPKLYGFFYPDPISYFKTNFQ